MAKIHTRVKRKWSKTRGRKRKRRLKTFATADAAKSWAESKKLKNYSVINSKSEENKVKKFKIIL